MILIYHPSPVCLLCTLFSSHRFSTHLSLSSVFPFLLLYCFLRSLCVYVKLQLGCRLYGCTHVRHRFYTGISLRVFLLLNSKYALNEKMMWKMFLKGAKLCACIKRACIQKQKQDRTTYCNQIFLSTYLAESNLVLLHNLKKFISMTLLFSHVYNPF